MTTKKYEAIDHSSLIEDVVRKVARQTTVARRAEVLKSLHDSLPITTQKLLLKALDYSYNPYIKFGLTLNPGQHNKCVALSRDTNVLGVDDEDFWKVLDDFRNSTESHGVKLEKLSRLCQRASRSATYIILGIINKNLIAKVSIATVNKAFPNLIPVFNVQLAQKYADKKVKEFPQYVEIKYDGVRAIGLIFPSGDVEVVTRTGRAIPAATYFTAELRHIGNAYKTVAAEVGEAYNGCITDGELCGNSFNDAVSIFRSHSEAESGFYYVFDILPMDALKADFVTKPFKDRKDVLNKVFNLVNSQSTGSPAPLTKVLKSNSYMVSSKEEIWTFYNNARDKNLEGIIVKNPEARWEKKRTTGWLKIKAEQTADLVIIGAFEGEGEKVGTLGGLIVDFKGTPVRVGTGYTKAVSDDLWAMFLRDLERSNNPDNKQDYELIGFLAEIEYQEITPAGSLRHPVFKRIRRDKEEISF